MLLNMVHGGFMIKQFLDGTVMYFIHHRLMKVSAFSSSKY